VHAADGFSGHPRRAAVPHHEEPELKYGIRVGVSANFGVKVLQVHQKCTTYLENQTE